MNENIYNILNSYAENHDPQYAIFLKGLWGCGKTYFIKNWMTQYDKDHPSDENALTLKPIYVSLYGIKQISDIRAAIDKEINPFFYSKTGKFITGFAKVLSKVVLKTDIDINSDKNSDISISGTIDPLSIFKTPIDEIGGVKFIIFDDLERCLLDMKEALGFINYFVEHYNCHVIIIGDDSHFTDDKKRTFEGFKEKTIGREFEIQADVNNAIKSFLDEVPISDFLKSEQELITSCFLATKYNNLRLLRQCLYDFKTQAQKYFDKIEKNKDFFRSLLCSYIVTYAEYHNVEGRDLFVSIAQKGYAFFLMGDKEKESANRLMSKYFHNNNTYISNVLNSSVSFVLAQIREGRSLDEYIDKQLSTEQKQNCPWNQLTDYWRMDNTMFNGVYMQTISALKNDKIIAASALSYVLAYLFYFDSLDIIRINDDTIEYIKKGIRQILCSSIDKKNLYENFQNLRFGYRRYIITEEPIPRVKEMMDFAEQIYREVNAKMKDDMQIALENLSDNNIEDLGRIECRLYPDGKDFYKAHAIFANVDANLIYHALVRMTNESRNSFLLFIKDRYGNAMTEQDATTFQDDIPFLKKLYNLIGNDLPSYTCIDKFSFNGLLTTIKSAIENIDKS